MREHYRTKYTAQSYQLGLEQNEEKVYEQKRIAKMEHYAREKDTILIRNEEELNTIWEWTDTWIESEEVSDFLSSFQIPLLQGSVLIYPLKKETSHFVRLCYRYTFEITSDNQLEIECYAVPQAMLGKGRMEKLFLKFRIDLTKESSYQLLYHDLNGEDIQQKMKYAGLIITRCQIFLSHYVQTKHVEHRKTTGEKKKKGKKSSSVRKMGKTTFIFRYSPELEKELREDIERREYERHIEAWTRRGHWRTITKKNGSQYQVWVEPTICRSKEASRTAMPQESGQYRLI